MGVVVRWSGYVYDLRGERRGGVPPRIGPPASGFGGTPGVFQGPPPRFPPREISGQLTGSSSTTIPGSGKLFAKERINE